MILSYLVHNLLLIAGVGDVSHVELLVVGLLCRDDGGVGDKREVDPGVRDQVGLELVQIHVKGFIKPQRGGDGGHDLGVKLAQVGVGGALDIKVPPADVIDSLVVDHEGAVTMLEGGVGIEGGVAGLNHGGGHNQGSSVALSMMRCKTGVQVTVDPILQDLYIVIVIYIFKYVFSNL